MRSILTIVTVLLIFINGTIAGKIEFIPDSMQIDKPFVYAVTIRPNHYDSLTMEYFPNLVAEEKAMTYLKVYSVDGKWLVHDLNSINDFKPENKDLQDWLVYVHGDSQSPDLAFMRGLQLQQEYKVNVIVFSWPSKDIKLGGLQNFRNSRNLIEQSTPAFARLLSELNTWKEQLNANQTSNLSLFLHSLGNYYLERIATDSLLANQEPGIFDNIILNAAAVNQKDHHLWLKEINIQNRIFVNSNRKDMTLKGINMFTDFDTQLGEQAIDNFAPNAVYVNFSMALKNELNFGLLHGYYVGVIPGKSQNIFEYYHAIFHGQDLDLSDRSRFVKNDTVPVYEITF
jgi:hypothetical protein